MTPQDQEGATPMDEWMARSIVSRGNPPFVNDRFQYFRAVGFCEAMDSVKDRVDEILKNEINLSGSRDALLKRVEELEMDLRIVGQASVEHDERDHKIAKLEADKRELVDLLKQTEPFRRGVLYGNAPSINLKIKSVIAKHQERSEDSQPKEEGE